MKSGIRVAALFVLLLMLSPILLALSRSGIYVFPLWWAVAFFVFRWSFPARKQASVPALAVLAGSLAYLIALSLYWSGAAVGLNVHAGALVLGMLWLFFSQSRASAIALIALQVGVSVTGAIALLHYDFAAAVTTRAAFIGAASALLASFFSHVFAILFLTIFILRKPGAPVDVGDGSTANTDAAIG